MRKFTFLLSFLFVILGLSAQTTVTYNFADKGFASAEVVNGGTIDANLSYVTDKNTAGNAPTFYPADGLRIYSVRATGEGNTFTINTSNGATITALEIYAFSTAYAPAVKYSVDGAARQDASLTETTYSITGINAKNSLMFMNAHTGGSSNTQLRITGFKVTYTMDANAPAITVSPATLDLGNSNLNVESAPQSVTITGANLTASPSFSTDNPEFVASGTLSTTGGTLNVTFKPTAAGERTGVLTITGNGVTKTVNLSGIGVDPSVISTSYDFKTTLDPFTQFSKTGTQVWAPDATFGAKMSGYDGSSKTNIPNEDWLISPTYDLSAGYESVVLNFGHAINYATSANVQANHTLWVSSNYTSGDPAGATWTQLTIPNYPPGNNWTFVESGDIAVPSAFMVSNVRFAFKYLSSDTEASTWEITPFSVSMKKVNSSVGRIKDLKLFISDGSSVSFEAVAGEIIEVYNIAGQQLVSRLAVDGLNTITVPVKGVAIVKVGNRTGKVIL